jgi:hypothetical protein
MMLLNSPSRRLWTKVTDAIKAKDMKAATDSKVDIEEAQRERTAKREEAGETWSPRYFRLDGETYVPVFRCVSPTRCAADLFFTFFRL